MKTNTILPPKDRPTQLHPKRTDLHQTHLLLQPTKVSSFLPVEFKEQEKTFFYQLRRENSPFLSWRSIPALNQ